MHVLIVEGGGMKACYANGVLSAFELAGYAPFDAVIGTSAGGALAAWFSAGQAAYAEGTWPYAADPRILSYGRFFTGRGPALDHDALLEIVYQDEHPLDQAALAAARWPVYVTAVDVDTGACVYQDIRGPDAISWLKATGRLPFASGPPVTIAGRAYLDGGILDPIPVRWAVEVLGATRVTLISNNATGRTSRDNRVMAGLVARKYPRLAAGVLRHNSIKAAAMAYAASPPEGVQIDVIRPASPTGLGRLTRDVAALQRIIQLGRTDGTAYLRRIGVSVAVTPTTSAGNPVAA